MNGMRRAEYLEAMGIAQYVSRWQLPGAAVSPRVELVPVAPAIARTIPDREPMRRAAPEATPVVEAETPREPATGSAAVPRFTLAVIVAGPWLWLEDLEDRPLASEQVALVQSMARALLVRRAQSQGSGAVTLPGHRRPVVEQLRWPMHNNHQLQLDADAARAGVAAFVSRKLQEHECGGMILLGRGSSDWVSPQGAGVTTVRTLGTLEMLRSPASKKAVWRDLLPLAGAN